MPGRAVMTGLLVVTVAVSAAGGAALARALAPRAAVAAEAGRGPAGGARQAGGRAAAKEDPHLRPSPPVGGAGRRAAGTAPAPGPGAAVADAGSRDGLAANLAEAILAGGTPMDAEQVAAVAASIARAAARYGLDPWLVYAVIRRESGFNPAERGAAGEIGLMQILPSTAAWVGRQLDGLPEVTPQELFDPALNVDLGTAYLARLVRENGGDLARALTAYNTGSAAGTPNRYALEVLRILRAVRPASLPRLEGGASRLARVVT